MRLKPLPFHSILGHHCYFFSVTFPFSSSFSEAASRITSFPPFISSTFSSTSNRIGTNVPIPRLFHSSFLSSSRFFFPSSLLTLCNFQIHRDKTDEPVPASLDCDFKREESIQFLGVIRPSFSFSTATGTARITSFLLESFFIFLFSNSKTRDRESYSL